MGMSSSVRTSAGDTLTSLREVEDFRVNLGRVMNLQDERNTEGAWGMRESSYRALSSSSSPLLGYYCYSARIGMNRRSGGTAFAPST